MSHDPLYITVIEIKSAVGVRTLNESFPAVDPVTGYASPAYPNLTADTAGISEIIEIVCDEIDDYIGSVATVPITGTIPGAIKRIAKALVVAQIYQDEAGIPQSVDDKEMEARKDLEKIQSGEMYCNGLSYFHDSVTAVNSFSTKARGSYTDPKFNMLW